MTRHFSFFSCDPGGIQTHDLQNRNLMLYSAKLQGQVAIAVAKITINYKETIAKLTKKRKAKEISGKTTVSSQIISIFKTISISLP